jgi:hypothetical protein
MSDDDTVTVKLEVDRDLLAAMQRVRKKQKKSRGKRTAQMSSESPGRLISNLLTSAYQSELMSAKQWLDDDGDHPLIEGDSRYNYKA